MRGMSDLGAVFVSPVSGGAVSGDSPSYLSPTTKPPDIAPGVFLCGYLTRSRPV